MKCGKGHETTAAQWNDLEEGPRTEMVRNYLCLAYILPLVRSIDDDVDF